jgi:hypothetical protein
MSSEKKTILEALNYANKELNENDSIFLFMGKKMLSWVTDLLNKGYSLDDDIGKIMSQYEDPALVPQKK